MKVSDSEYDLNTRSTLKGFFTVDELKCKCGCNTIEMDLPFLHKLVKIREELGLPMIVSSGYRCAKHPEEAKKKGAYWQGHVEGRAIDVKYKSKSYRAKLIRIAYKHGMRGIGIANSFVHLDDRDWDALYFYPGFKG